MTTTRFGLVLSILIGTVTIALAQTPPPPPVPQSKPVDQPTPPDRSVVAATVNGQAIPELAVFRALSRESPARREVARKEIISFLVDMTLIDQYLLALKVTVDPKEIDKRIEEIKKEAGKDFERFLANLYMTEAELREQLTSALRWDKFVMDQSTDKVLR